MFTMQPHVQYYATETLYHMAVRYPCAEYFSRFPTIDLTVHEMRKRLEEENVVLPSNLRNGPTKKDVEQHRIRGETPRKLSVSEEQEVLTCLGIRT